MKNFTSFRFVFFCIFSLTCVSGCKIISDYCIKQDINPIQYGLSEAKTGEDRYNILLRTHTEALRLGVGVSYAGIKRIELSIPSNAKPIPLTHYTDFADVIIRVDNKQKEMYLFSLSMELIPVTVRGKQIDNRNFSDNPSLKTGSKLLVITDKTPWVDNRRGHDYGATRKDIMLVRNGIGGNSTVQSYCTNASSPECYYCDVDESVKTVFKNVTMERTTTSTKITNLVRIENQYNVELKNITINTPEGTGLSRDRAVFIVNCLDVSLSDVTINGTYSLIGTFGYGVSLDNTCNLRVNNMFARAHWGVFGNNNVNKASLTNCDINRFDIHCYGKDISFEKCNFVDLFNQLASVYGEVNFKDCIFTSFKPILIASSYNAYTAFDAKFENCIFNFDESHCCVIDFSGFEKEINKRPELQEKCLPNVTIKNCRVNMIDGSKKWYVYNTKKTKGYEGRFSYLSKVTIEGVEMSDKALEMEFFSKYVQTTNKVELKKHNYKTTDK